MGWAEAALKKARAAFEASEYRWVAEVVNHVVFADPDNEAARALQADALEQLGYQSESGLWWNFYLSGASELHNGVLDVPAPSTSSADNVTAMTTELFWDYLGMPGSMGPQPAIAVSPSSANYPTSTRPGRLSSVTAH